MPPLPRSDVVSGGGYGPPLKKKPKPAPKPQSDVVSGGGYTKPKPQPKPAAAPAQTDTTSSGPRPVAKPKPEPHAAQPPAVHTDAFDRPDPQLQQFGINRSVGQFNDWLNVIHHTFQERYGRMPSPGLVYDILRSPLDLNQLPGLWQVPDSHAQAESQAALAKERKDNAFDYFHQRPDGRWDLADPIQHFLGGELAAESQAGVEFKGYRTATVQQETPSGALRPVQTEAPLFGKPQQPDVHRDYPWVSVAALPIPGWDKFWTAIKDVHDTKLNPGDAQLVEQGKTLSDFEYHLKQAKLDEAQRRYGAQMSAVQTVKGGQRMLQKVAPEYFSGLSADGYFNADWAKALKLYKASTQGAVQQTEYDAKQAGLSVKDYVQAWRNKQRLLGEHPGYYQMIVGMDLKLLVHPNSFFGSAGDLANYIAGGFHPSSATWWIGLPITSLAHEAELGFKLVGGSVNQYKAYATAMHIALQDGAKVYGSHSETKAEMDAKLRKALTERPSWAKIVFPGLDDKGWLGKVDHVTNFLGDVLLLGKPSLTGERVAVGDLGAATRSRYLNATADLAWREARKHGPDGVARAAGFLESESGFGAERLLEATAKDIAAGKLSKPEFQALTARLYAHGQVEYGGKTIGGGLLHSLYTDKLVPKNVKWQSAKAAIADLADRTDAALRSSPVVGSDAATTFLNTVRNLFSHAYPKGEYRNFYEPRLPQRIFDYAKGTFKDPKLADKWRNDFVRARARDDVPGMQNVFDRMSDRYHKDFNVKGGPREPFDALFVTEAPSRGYFPAGGVKDVEGVFANLADGARRINDLALKLTAWHRRTIVSGAPIPGVAVPPGGFVLFEKHAVADTIRRIVGGGAGLRFEQAAYDELLNVARAEGNEPLLRTLRQAEARTKEGETRYYLRASSADAETFNTADRFRSGRHMAAAGGYLRRIFTDDAIGALTRSSADDLSPLVQFMRSHPQYRNLVASKTRREGGGLNVALAQHFPPNDEAFASASYQDQAEAMWRRYQEIVDGARQAGVEDPVRAIRQIVHNHEGSKLDQALGRWVADNRVEFKVRSGLVEQKGGLLDGWSQRYIGWLMKPNKWNRAGMFKHVLANTYKTLREAGWSEKDAAESAIGLAERQTVYHLLDFQNMLKVEQDLRWASYFATKHRLYWKWVTNIVWRRPGLAVAAHDFQQNLDGRGNIEFGLFGQRFGIPIPRLLWLNSVELPEVSTPIVGVQGAIEGMRKGKNPFAYAWSHAGATSGNIITRDDQAWIAAYHLALSPRTYSAAVGGMGPKQAAIFNREVNQFQVEFLREHGHFAPEPEAVTWALQRTLLYEGLRANFAVPTWMPGKSEAEHTQTQNLWERYSRLTTPAKRSAFLDKHPDLAAQIAQTKDPAVYTHNQEFFARFRAVSDARAQARDGIYRKALQSGWTPELEAEWRKAGRVFSEAMRQLELDDARTWPGSPSYPKGEVQEGQVVTPGPFARAIQGNPFLARKQLKELFPHITPEELRAKTIGQTVEALQAERDFLNSPAGQRTYKDKQALRDRLSEISDRLSHFQGYPKTAAERFHAAYYDRVDAYRTKRDQWRQRISLLPSDEQERAYEELRAWEDEQDKPTTITVGNKAIRFPSPVRVGYELATPDEKRQTWMRWASDDWSHLSNFAKEKLAGRKLDPSVSKGQLLLQLALSGLAADRHAQKRLLDEYNIRVPELPPGESLDARQRAAVVKQIDAAVGAGGKFVQDYNFAQKPTVARLKTFPAIRRDPHWQDLFDQVSYFLGQAKRAGYSGTEKTIKDVYRRQVVPQLKARVATEGRQFRDEIALFVRQDPNFWNKLIAP